LTINNKVSQSVPALRMKDVEFIDKTNTEHNKNKILRFNLNCEPTFLSFSKRKVLG
jgi:hypothetical protein